MDSLNIDLTSRPTEAELQARGILINSDIAPALQSTATTLEMELKRNRLSSNLASRPDADSLQTLGVHSPSKALSPSLASAAATLEHNLTRDKLAKGLRERSPKAQLEKQGYFSPLAPTSA